jgi:hypothetical protein
MLDLDMRYPPKYGLIQIWFMYTEDISLIYHYTRVSGKIHGFLDFKKAMACASNSLMENLIVRYNRVLSV